MFMVKDTVLLVEDWHLYRRGTQALVHEVGVETVRVSFNGEFPHEDFLRTLDTAKVVRVPKVGEWTGGGTQVFRCVRTDYHKRQSLWRHRTDDNRYRIFDHLKQKWRAVNEKSLPKKWRT